MTKISEAHIHSVRLQEQASNPTTPASGYFQIFVKTDGLYLINSSGEVFGPLGAPTSTIKLLLSQSFR